MDTQADRAAGLTPRRRCAVRRSLVLLVAVVVLVVGDFLVAPVRVASTSMEPTLRPGDHLLVLKGAYRHELPKRGDLVVFDWDGSPTLKRVAAVAGDTVGIEDGVLTVNGRPVREPAVEMRLVDGMYYGPAPVPDGTVFLLGDNRRNSLDSRRFGPVPVEKMAGRVVLRWWPRPRWL
ncbi:signal peptidase I [Streptomyces acidicola]|uniref:signal peptidase I n=1 Tax=Streptomyces acidicola TaxID=2596892 RepID=UPI0037FBE6FF